MTEKKAHRPGGCVGVFIGHCIICFFFVISVCTNVVLISKYLLQISWNSPRVEVAQKVSK